MSAAFLVGRGSRRASSSAEFSKEQEERGLQFNVENAAEDIVNTLFCTYEPPTSKKMQYKAAKAFRRHPERYANRPHAPKSILKFKIPTPRSKRHQYQQQPPPDPKPVADEGRDDIAESGGAADPNPNKKSVTWRDQQHDPEDRTDLEHQAVNLASKYCGGACHGGENIADVLSSPTGRVAQTFFAGGPETPGSMANMASGLFGGTTTQGTAEDGSVQTQTKIFYDDLGNPVREDDFPQDDDDQASYFPTTPKDVAAAIAAEAAAASASVEAAKRNGQHPNTANNNLFCSNIPFMDTVMTGIGIAGVMAASAAVKAGVPETYCRVYNRSPIKQRKSADQEQISEELRQARESLGVYEPESYDRKQEQSIADPMPGGSKLKRQSTPRHVRRTGTPRNLYGGNDREDDDDDAPRDGHDNTTNPYSGQRSYANSDITMGNTTIKHFGGASTANGTASLFDNVLEEDAKSPSAAGRGMRGGFSSMVEELKQVQKERRNYGSSQHTIDLKKNKKPNDTDAIGVSVSSIKHDYEKSCKSPRHSVATSSYLSSIKKSPVGGADAGSGAALPATPNHNRNSDSELFERRNGAVANLAKQFESPRSNYRAAASRKSIDPSESRFFDGTVDLLPPTPRRKSPDTPTGYSMAGNSKIEVHDWGGIDTNAPTPSSQYNNNAAVPAQDMMSPKSMNTYNTDGEVREAPSSIFDAAPTRNRPKFAGRRPRSLVTGPETVQDEEDDEPSEEDRRKKTSNKKNKRGKSKDRRDRSRGKSKERTTFANKLKKSMEKALNPVKSVTRKLEASRIHDGVSF